MLPFLGHRMPPSTLCSDLHGPYTVFIAPYSLSRGSLLKFTSFQHIHSWICFVQRLQTNKDECDIIYLCKYLQFKFTSRTHQCSLNGTYIRFELKSWRLYPVMSTSQVTYVQIEQTPEGMRETYKCAEWGGTGIENRWVNYSIPFQNTLPQRRL